MIKKFFKKATHTPKKVDQKKLETLHKKIELIN